MKKLTTLLISIATFIGTANATVFHVDPTGGSSTANGLTWATAVKNIEQAQVLADANPGTDDIYVKGGTLLYPGSSLVIRATNDVNVYGSFQGIEGETRAVLGDIPHGLRVVECDVRHSPKPFLCGRLGCGLPDER